MIIYDNMGRAGNTTAVCLIFVMSDVVGESEPVGAEMIFFVFMNEWKIKAFYNGKMVWILLNLIHYFCRIIQDLIVWSVNKSIVS